MSSRIVTRLFTLVGLVAALGYSSAGRASSSSFSTGFVRPFRQPALWTKTTPVTSSASSSSALKVAEKTQETTKLSSELWQVSSPTTGSSNHLAPLKQTKSLGPKSGGVVGGFQGTVMKGVKKVGAVGLAVVLTGIVLVAGLPAVTNAASASLADLSAGASSQYNNIVSKLAASGFLQAFSLVFVSEIGDKTFFIAGLLAMKTSRLISFTGSMAALSVMTVISVLIGQIFHAIPAGLAGGFKFDQWIAVLAFSYFGFKTLKDAYDLPEGDISGIEEEKAEAEKAVSESAAPEQKTPWGTILQIFSLVFAAEFGDRSFLSTIALGAAQNPFSVAGGAIGAHATATGIAVASGAFLSKYISEKVIGYVGGGLFVIFAITTALGVF